MLYCFLFSILPVYFFISYLEIIGFESCIQLIKYSVYTISPDSISCLDELGELWTIFEWETTSTSSTSTSRFEFPILILMGAMF